MSEQKSGFERWLSKNPGGTFDQYTKVLSAFNASKVPVPPPNFRYLPDGIAVSVAGFSPADVLDIGRETIQSAYQQQ